MSIDLGPIRKTLVKKTGEEETVRPVLLVNMYSDWPIDKLSPAAGKLLRAYLELIPKGALRSCANEEDVGALSPRRLTRDLKLLDSPPKNEDFNQIYYSSSENGPPGDHGVTFLLDDFDGEAEDETLETNLLKFEFPWTDAEDDKLEGFIERVRSLLAIKAGVMTATAGFGFSHWHFDRFAFDQVLAMVPRYLGFDPSEELPAKTMRGHTPIPSWLTYLDGALMAALGGEAALRKEAPRAAVTPAGDGVIIRAAKRPPVGDANRGAADLGELPGVARFLKPKRVTIPFLRGHAVEFDVPRWTERLDGLENGPWDNR